MNSNFSASAVLVKTERSRAPGRLAAFENAYDPFDPDGAGYAANARGIPTFAERHEKKAIRKKPPHAPTGDDRFFDGHH